MDVLKAYAHQVVSYHPAKARDDLFAEIYDELCEEFSDWKAAHPGGDEAAFIDAEKQHPMRFATRLAAEGSAYLVGPQFYFSFISALKIGATITSMVFLVLGVISAIASGDYPWSFLRVLSGIPQALLWVGACILGVFIALEKSGERANWLDDWSASDLKPLDSHQQISRGETLFDLGISILALLWVLDIVNLPATIRVDGSWSGDWVLQLPGWFWIAAGALLVFDIAYSLLRLTRNLWTAPLRLASVVTNVLWISLLGYAIAQPQLVAIAGDMPEQVTNLLPIVDRAVSGVLLVICAIVAWDTVTHVWRLRR
jgi:hypothetical protein